MCTCNFPVFQYLWCKTFFIVDIFILIRLCQAIALQSFIHPKQLVGIALKTIGDNIMSYCYTSDLGFKENPQT